MSPVAEVVGKECLQKGQPDHSTQHGVACINEPDNAQRFHPARVAFQLELEAGHGRTRCRGRTATLVADRLPRRQSLTTPAAKHAASSSYAVPRLLRKRGTRRSIEHLPAGGWKLTAGS